MDKYARDLYEPVPTGHHRLCLALAEHVDARVSCTRCAQMKTITLISCASSVSAPPAAMMVFFCFMFFCIFHCLRGVRISAEAQYFPVTIF